MQSHVAENNDQPRDHALYRSLKTRHQLTSSSTRASAGVTSFIESRAALERELENCAKCLRLKRWRVAAAELAPASIRGAAYWSKPVPSFGNWDARVWILGLAPGAHGANRTGRPFTGDGAGPFLYSALHRAGFANDVTPSARGDGLQLIDARILNAVRCAPPGNRPTPDEIARCAPFLLRELALAERVRVLLCLGEIAWKAALRALGELGELPKPRPRFAHGAHFDPGDARPVLLASFHPSQLNTRTGRLTPAMLDSVLAQARKLVAGA